jgi:uncharacterized repeat protein (TIGR02543 family)
MKRVRLWAVLLAALLLCAGYKDFFHPEGPTMPDSGRYTVTDEEAAEIFRESETIKEALKIEVTEIGLDFTEGELAAIEAKVDEALAAYAKLPEGARGAVAEEKAKLDAVKQKIGHVYSAQQFRDAHTAVLEKQADDVNTIEDVTALLPVLDEALKEYEALAEPVKELLKGHGTVLKNLKAKAEAITEENATEKDKEAAEAFRKDHAGILTKTLETVSLGDEAAADAALNAYAGLSETVKALLLLTGEHGKLTALKEKIEALKPVAVTITFESHEGSPVPDAITGNMGTKVNAPADPKRAGYTFLGWFDKESGGAKFAWPHTLAGDVIMHAYWQDDTLPPPPQYTITFDSHEGSPVEAITGAAGTAVKKPDNPTRNGYTFRGWFPTASGGTAYTWDHTLTANITMHAQWVRQYTITFDSHGGSPVPDAVTADEGTAVPKPADPKRADYDFAGWFSAASGGAPYSWPHTLTGDVTMHAQWMPEVSFGVTVKDQDGSILDLDGTITIYKDGNHGDINFTATVNGGYGDVQWYLNGGPLGGAGTSMTINAKDYKTGNYYLGISVSKGGVYYSTNIYFTVKD